MSDNTTYAAGWYPDANLPGTERYYDGTTWTTQSRPIPAPSTTAVTIEEPPVKRPWYKRKAIIIPAAIIIGLIILGNIIGAINGTGRDAVPAADDKVVSEPAAEVEQVAVPDVVGMTVTEATAAVEAVGLVLFVMNEDDSSPEAIISTQTTKGEREPGADVSVLVEPKAVEGSLSAPYPLGYQVSIYEGDPDNELAVLSAAIKDANAGAAIAQANQFNEPAQPGYHYVAVEYTFTGSSPTEPANVSYLLYDWSLAQTDGVLIAENNSSVVLPEGWNDTYDVNDLYQGQTGAAVVLYQVPDAYTGTLLATAYGKYLTL